MAAPISLPITSTDTALRPARRGSLRPWVLSVGAFFAIWALYVTWSDSWRSVAAHWPIAVAMALGSFVAGSTPMGGGSIGFPVLVLGFGHPATLGRDFSFAIQSIGMVSATIFILASGRPLERGMLRSALLGSAIGTPLGLLLFAPHISELIVKVAFAVLVASFGLLHLAKHREICAMVGMLPTAPGFDRYAGLAVGALGGALIASITGVGIDMLIYVVLVLLCRADLRIAIPTSVVLMASTSLLGLATQNLLGRMNPDVFAHWLAAAPVVALGAPLGALLVEKIGRRATLVFVSVLCILQFCWTLHHERAALGILGIGLSLLGVLLFSGALAALYRTGKRLARR